jgi:hypothetical protein
VSFKGVEALEATFSGIFAQFFFRCFFPILLHELVLCNQSSNPRIRQNAEEKKKEKEQEERKRRTNTLNEKI